MEPVDRSRRTDAGRPASSSPMVALSWCLFDWANSPFATIITTFIFATYFTKAVASDPATGTSQWGWAVSMAGLVIAVMAPLLGACVDRLGRRKPWLAGLSGLCIVSTAMLWFTTPETASVGWALGWLVLATVGYELGLIFYNAMLTDVAPPERLGRLSGWAWGLGYLGGLVALVIALFVLIKPEIPPFGLDKALQEPVRATTLLTAGWFAAFSVPLFLWVPDAPRRDSFRQACSHALDDLKHLWRVLRAHPAVLRFLLAQMLYTDGLNTLFAFGGIYAAGTFGMNFDQIILLGILLNVSAGLGAFLFGWCDDRFGARRTITIALLAILVLGGSLLVITSQTMFWGIAVLLGIFFGPAQSASRSLMARLAPAEARNEMFGLFALSGKVTAFAGPMVLAWATALSGSQRVGMASILAFLLAGLVLLRRVPVR